MLITKYKNQLKKSQILLLCAVCALTISGCKNGADDSKNTAESPQSVTEQTDNVQTGEEANSESNTDADLEAANKILDEMIVLSDEGWDLTEKVDYEQAEEKFVQIQELYNDFLSEHPQLQDTFKEISQDANPKQVYVKTANSADASKDETIDWFLKNTEYEPIYLDLSEEVSPYTAMNYLFIDSFAGITGNRWFAEGQSKAAEYAKSVYQELGDIRIRTLSELYAMDMVSTVYDHGYVDDAFMKAESDKLIPVLAGKIISHAGGTERSLRNWKKPLALFYYILEDFDTYLYIKFDGQDVDEIEPLEVVDDPNMTKLEYIIYGLRWNEEIEDYETFTLNRYWGYAEKESRDATYCNITGRFSKHTWYPSATDVCTEEFKYSEDGRIANKHIVSDSQGFVLIEDITDTDYVWTNNMRADLMDQEDWFEILLNAYYNKDESDPVYTLTEKMHGDSYVDGSLEYSSDNETTDKYSLYGELLEN